MLGSIRDRSAVACCLQSDHQEVEPSLVWAGGLMKGKKWRGLQKCEQTRQDIKPLYYIDVVAN